MRSTMHFLANHGLKLMFLQHLLNVLKLQDSLLLLHNFYACH
jgi:hypothetical protein